VSPAGDPIKRVQNENLVADVEDKGKADIIIKENLVIPESKRHNSTTNSIDKEISKKEETKSSKSKVVDPIQKAIQNKLNTPTPSSTKSEKSLSSPPPTPKNHHSLAEHSKTSQITSSFLSQSVDEPNLKMGWIKMRGFHVWWNRWAVLRFGKLIYYRNEKKEDCFGIILLNGCEIQKEPKKGFCFKVFHPEMKNIYSNKGLKGETLTSAKLPGSTDHCILAVATEQDRLEWMDLIKLAIEKASSDKLSDNHDIQVPPSPTMDSKPTNLLVPNEKDDSKPITRSPSSSDLKETNNVNDKTSSVDVTERIYHSMDEYPTDDKIDIDLTSKSAESSPPTTITDMKEEFKESAKIFSDPSSEEEDEIDQEKTIVGSPSKTPSSNSSDDLRSSMHLHDIRRDSDENLKIHLKDKSNSDTPIIHITDTTKKEGEETKLNVTIETLSTHSSIKSSIDNNKEKQHQEEEEVKSHHVHYYKEGFMQMKTTKSWKDYFFIVKKWNITVF